MSPRLKISKWSTIIWINAVIKGRKEITVCDILKEIYFYKYHGVENEEEYIRFLL